MTTAPFFSLVDMDHQLTAQMQRWLDTTNRDDATILEGAEMLLRINRNRYMFNRACARPKSMEDKIEYELRKHLRYRLDGYTLQEVAALDARIMPKVAEVVKEEERPSPVKKTGKRDDHDLLPLEIQEIWEANHRRWVKIKNLYNTLLGMDKAAPCDRYEYLKQLSDLFNAYREQMAVYDAYKAGDPVKIVDCTPETALKYLRTHVKAVVTLHGRSRDRMVENLQKRYNFLKASNYAFSDKLLAKLKEAGVET